MRRNIRFLCAALILSLFIAVGCGPQTVPQPTQTQLPIFISSTATMTITPTSTEIIPTSTSQPETTEEILPSPTYAAVEFPSTPEPPKLNWRPVLYQPPLALNLHDHFYFSRPIPPSMTKWFESDYRYGYIFPNTDLVHTGIDIAEPMGTPILAAASGIVTWAGHNLAEKSGGVEDPYGLAVAIRHDFGFQGRRITTIYAHMGRVDVKVGQSVSVGEQLGVVGNTGFTTGPHLHFEVRLQSPGTFTSRNPELWIVPPEGDGVLTGRVMDSYGLFLTSKLVTVQSLTDQKIRTGVTYGPQTVRSDDFFGENFVLSDLPAGKYQVIITFNWVKFSQNIQINPGTTSYFSFTGYQGFSLKLPNVDSQNWLVPLP